MKVGRIPTENEEIFLPSNQRHSTGLIHFKLAILAPF
jgi:hypothetical protein